MILTLTLILLLIIAVVIMVMGNYAEWQEQQKVLKNLTFEVIGIGEWRNFCQLFCGNSYQQGILESSNWLVEAGIEGEKIGYALLQCYSPPSGTKTLDVIVGAKTREGQLILLKRLVWRNYFDQADHWSPKVSIEKEDGLGRPTALQVSIVPNKSMWYAHRDAECYKEGGHLDQIWAEMNKHVWKITEAATAWDVARCVSVEEK